MGTNFKIPPDRSFTDVIVTTLMDMQRQLERLEDRQLRIMRELDAMDRRARPDGDGTRVRPRGHYR